jgi:hypothetical protein
MGQGWIQAIKLKEGVKIVEEPVDHLGPSVSPQIFLNHLLIIFVSHIDFVVAQMLLVFSLKT